jgi:tRNA dimethylallyltransferase
MTQSYTENRILAIVGPTSSGKTDLALRLAKKFHGEIVSADSRQIYRGMNVGTGTVPGKWIAAIFRGREKDKYFIYQKIPHFCLDFLDPAKAYSAAQFCRDAQKAVKSIRSRGRLPIVCGGTGFWIDALLNNVSLAAVRPNPNLRKKLEKQTLVRLFARLKKLNQKRAHAIDRHNKRRLIRALEIELTPAGTPPARIGLRPLYLGLAMPNAEIKKRIKTRFLQWLKGGLLAETRRLMKIVNKKRLREIGMEYPLVAEYLSKKTEREEMVRLSVNAIYHYAKRQIAWFKRNKKIRWIKNYREAEKLVKNFLA